MLSTAPDGVYRVLDGGAPVAKNGDYYNIMDDTWQKAIDLELMARVDSDGVACPLLGDTTFRADGARVVMMSLPAKT